MICHCLLWLPGSRSSDTGSILRANSFLWCCAASPYSSLHHFELTQASETRKRTASQRVTASENALAQRSPAAMPRDGSRSRKMSSSPLQPFSTSQSRMAIAQSSFLLEWEMNRRDKRRSPTPYEFVDDIP